MTQNAALRPREFIESAAAEHCVQLLIYEEGEQKTKQR